MASIFYAWEFGAALGHVGAFMPLARALRERGHAVSWAVAQPAQVGSFLAQSGFEWLPAPVLPEQPQPGPPLSYADILLRFGYAHPEALFGLTGAWRSLMQATRAKLVLTDHAPTAVLAARSLGLPVMMFSNGFTVPPRCNPMPNMRPWIPVPTAPLAAMDLQAAQSMNWVLQRYGGAPLASVADLFDVAEETLLSFPELDHYADRGPARYWGCLPSAGGEPVSWPPSPAPKVFAYLRPEVVLAEPLLKALSGRAANALVYFPGVSRDARERWSGPGLAFLDQPADLAQLARDADLGITYGSLATTTAFLLAGRPVLLLPGHLEQFLVARRVVEMGAGELVNPESPPADLSGTLQALLGNPAYRENARAFAAKYAAFDQARVVENLVRRIEELVT